MSMEERRDKIGKLLVCLLVSRKGIPTIRDLEGDYRENEGRDIPYREFGCFSLLEFFRSISNHVNLELRFGTYLVHPVVTEKIKHVDELVSRQKSGKKQTPVRRRTCRTSQYYPAVREPKPFIPNDVQKEIAQILTTNQSGVNKSYIAQCLKQSKAISGTVNVDNIDDYLRGMPYTAVARGNMVYPSQSLLAATSAPRHNVEEIKGFEIVMLGGSENANEPSSRNNNTHVVDAYPAGAEDEDEETYSEDEFLNEYTQPHSSHMDNNCRVNNNYQHQQLSRTGNENETRISSAEFIDKAGSQYTNSQYKAFVGENNNEKENYDNGVAFDGNDNRDEQGNSERHAEYTFESDDDGSMNIISPRLKSRLQQLIQKYPDGIWCANLLQVYLDEYKVPLDYVDLGFGSVCELASYLCKIFHLHRHNNRGDFMLYDATRPLPLSANKPESVTQCDVWENEYCDEDLDPFPMTLPLQTSRGLIPDGVMSHGESVGQERIPEIHDGLDCLEVYVVEVYTPSLFWIHLRKQRSKLSQLMESMHEFYQKEGENYTIPHVILEKGLNCVCTFEYKWHRAIIKTVKPNGDVTLIFYDYGTTKTYHPNSIRFLVRAYSNLPAQAIPCGLYNVKPINADAWTRGVSSEFYTKVADLPLIAIVVKIDRDNNSMQVSLVDTTNETDEHINDWLVDQGFAESGIMVRSRPSNFAFRHYVACTNHNYLTYIKTPRLIKRVKVNSRVNSRDGNRSQSESDFSSKVKLKSANFVRSLMARHSKYQKESSDHVSKNMKTRTDYCPTNTPPVVHIGARVKDCSLTNVSTLQTINPSLEKIDEKHIYKSFKDQLSLMNAKQDNNKSIETIPKVHVSSYTYKHSKDMNLKQSDDSSTSAQSVEHNAQVSDDSNLHKISKASLPKNVKNKDVERLEFSGTFRSFYGGHGDMAPIDWSKLRNDVQLEQKTEQKTKAKAQTIAESPMWPLCDEVTKRSGAVKRTDKCNDDLSKKSLHRNMASDIQKVTVKSVHKKIEEKILPAKDCFLNAVRSNKDHYYSTCGEKLWWSPNGNIQDKQGVINPLLRKRIKSFKEADIDLSRVSASPEVLQMLRGKKLQDTANGAISKDLSDPDLDFLIQLTRVTDLCTRRTSNPSKIQNVQTLKPQNKVSSETSASLKQSTSQALKISKLSPSAHLAATFGNTNEDKETHNKLSNSRIATFLDYMNKKKKQNVNSISAENLSTESSNVALDTNSVQSSTSISGSLNLSESFNTSGRIPNIKKDFGMSCEHELNYTRDADKDYIISSSQESSNTNLSIENPKSKSDSLSSENIETVSKSNELSEDQIGPEVSEVDRSPEKVYPTSNKNQNKISTVNTTNVRSTSTVINSSNTTDYNRADIQVSSLFNAGKNSSKSPKKLKSYSKFSTSTDSISDLDSDDLSRSYSYSETDILQIVVHRTDVKLTKDIQPNKLDDEKISFTSGDSLLDGNKDILEQFEHDNMLVNPENNKEIENQVSRSKSKIFVPMINDSESMADSDEWEVNGEWKDFMKGNTDFMSHIVRKLEIANRASELTKIVEVTDNSELEDVFNRDDHKHDQIVKPIIEEIYEEIYDTVDGKNRESKREPGHLSMRIQNSRINKENESIVTISNDTSAANLSQLYEMTADNISTVTRKSYGNEGVIDKTHDVGNNTEIFTQDLDHTSLATTSEKPLEIHTLMSKTKSIRDMLENFQSKRNLGWVSDNLKKLEHNSLHSKTNASAISESKTNKNVESDVNISTEDEKSGEMNAKQSLSISEMFAGSVDTSSSSQCSITFISNDMIVNGTDKCKNHQPLPEQRSITEEESHTSSSDAIKFIEEQSEKLQNQFPILSRIKKQRLSVKSPLKDLGVQNTSQININADSDKDSSTLNQSCESDNNLSRSLLDKGDTVDLECSYLEDRTKQTRDVVVGPEYAPLILPQSTLPESTGHTLKPPPGFTKPSELMNYAAFMDHCLHERSQNTMDMGNSTFLNFCSVNLNNNPLVPQPEALIQFWKQRLQLELTAALNQFFLSNSNASAMNNIILNNSNTVSPSTSMKDTEQSHKNPFQTYQESNGQEFSPITNSLDESTDGSKNLNISKSNNLTVQNGTTSPSLEKLPNVSSRDSNLLGFEEQNLFSSKSTEGFGMSRNKFGLTENYESIETKQENFGANGANIGNDEEFTVHQLHDTNPFKQHVIRSFNVKVESQKEKSLKTNIEYDNIIKPPIPPRNPNLINNTPNIGTKHRTDVTCNTLPVSNNRQNIPTTRIHFRADPVMYNSKTETTHETKSKLGNKTTNLSQSVSSGDNNHYDIANSSQNFTNDSLHTNIFNFGETDSLQGCQNSLQSGLDSQLDAAQTNSIFNPSTKFTTNHMQCTRPRIISDNYRPPSPPYNQNNSTEYLYKIKSPMSQQFISPVVSENSKAAIQEVQLATEFNLFDKLKSIVTGTPDPTKHNKTLANLGKCEAHTSSLSLTRKKNVKSATTSSESTLHSQNAARSSTSYKIKLIIPKSLQGQQTTVSLKQDPPDTSYRTQVLNETSGITPSMENIAQDFVEHEQSSSMRKDNHLTLPGSTEHQGSYSPNGDSSKNSGRPENYPTPFDIETGNTTAQLAYDGLRKKQTENASSPIPTLHDPQTPVNGRHLLQKDYNNCSVTSIGCVTLDTNCSKSSNTEFSNTIPDKISYLYQPQPLTPPYFPPLYPNIGQLQHGPDYPYHISPPEMQHPQIAPRIPLFRPNEFYPPASHWPRPQFSHPHNNFPPMLQSYPWNPCPSHILVHKQTNRKHGIAIPNSQTRSQTDCNRESVSSGLNHAQMIGQKNKENINSVQNKETLDDVSSKLAKSTTNQSSTSGLTDLVSGNIANELKNSHSNDTLYLKNCTLPTQLHELHTRTASENISENTTEKFVEDTTFTQRLNSTQVLRTLPIKNNSEKSLNGHAHDIPQHTPSRTLSNVFKPIEVNKQMIYLFNIENEGWACTDEIALAFTPYENRNMILRLLELVQVHINFKEISRAQSPLLFSNLDGTTVRLPRMTNSKKIKGTLHLTPLNSLIRMMYYLKIISVEEIICSPSQKQLPPGSKIPELVKLITAYRIDDKYWVA